MSGIATYLFHVIVLTRSELGEFIGRWRALTGALLYIVSFGAAAYLLTSMQRELGFSPQVLRDQMLSPEFGGVMAQLGFERLPEMLRYVVGQPSSVWIFQLVGMFWYPLFITLLSFDAVASDVNRGTPRFVIQRTSRASYLSSKYLAHIAFYLLLHGLAICLLWIAGRVWLPGQGIGSALLQYAPPMSAFIAMVTAATVFVSSLCRSAGKALIWTQLFWVLLLIASAYLPWANPFRGEWLMGLMMPQTGYGRGAAVGFLVWTIGMFLAGLLRWEWRDL